MNAMVKNNGAEFSTCGKYRYKLWRIWDKSKPMVMFIGLNPSRADQAEDDPTIRRVKRFAADWGYGGVYMLNLFPYVTPYPSELIMCERDHECINDNTIRSVARTCACIVFAWGNFKEAVVSGNTLKALYPEALCLQKNKNGSPKHPLYVRATIEPILFNEPNKTSK